MGLRDTLTLEVLAEAAKALEIEDSERPSVSAMERATALFSQLDVLATNQGEACFCTVTMLHSCQLDTQYAAEFAIAAMVRIHPLAYKVSKQLPRTCCCMWLAADRDSAECFCLSEESHLISRQVPSAGGEAAESAEHAAAWEALQRSAWCPALAEPPLAGHAAPTCEVPATGCTPHDAACQRCLAGLQFAPHPCPPGVPRPCRALGMGWACERHLPCKPACGAWEDA